MVRKHKDHSEPTLESLSDVVAEEPTPVVPIPEIPAAAIPETEPKDLPVPQQPLIALRVYAAMSGVRWDQAAGFLAYAKLRKLGPMTMEQWQAELDKFNNRPV